MLARTSNHQSIEKTGTGRIQLDESAGNIEHDGTGSIEHGGTGAITKGGAGRIAICLLVAMALAVLAAPATADTFQHENFMVSVDRENAAVSVTWHFGPKASVLLGTARLEKGYAVFPLYEFSARNSYEKISGDGTGKSANDGLEKISGDGTGKSDSDGLQWGEIEIVVGIDRVSGEITETGKRALTAIVFELAQGTSQAGGTMFQMDKKR